MAEIDLDALIIGPDYTADEMYYIEIPSAKTHWTADIDDNLCSVVCRDSNFRVLCTLYAADPEFFTKLEVHIRERINERRTDQDSKTH